MKAGDPFSLLKCNLLYEEYKVQILTVDIWQDTTSSFHPGSYFITLIASEIEENQTINTVMGVKGEEV